MKYILVLCRRSIWNISQTKKNVHRSSYKVPINSVRIKFWHFLSKNPQIKKFMKFCPVGAELLYVDGQTDGHDEVHSRFRSFAELHNDKRNNLQVL
jgi:hypothetical protein